jgi:hypothetical protein
MIPAACGGDGLLYFQSVCLVRPQIRPDSTRFDAPGGEGAGGDVFVKTAVRIDLDAIFVVNIQALPDGAALQVQSA